MDEKDLIRIRRNEVLGLVDLETKIKRNPNGYIGDSEMLPFLDFLVNRELNGTYIGGRYDDVETFLVEAVENPVSGNIYQDLVYDRSLLDVTKQVE